jgi:FkbM family methyltransferase
VNPVVEPLQPSEQKLDPERVVDVETNVGTLWLERDAKILTPTLVESGAWQPDVINLMKRFVRPGMTVVDAGANVGYVSVCASKLAGPTGRVFCVEVDPANVSLLRANLWRNGCTNATVLPVAAWSERAELKLSVIPEGGGACSQVSADAPDGSAIAAYRLDDLIDGPVDYLKIDCEGTDHMVLKGATGLFRANRSLLATVELAPGLDSQTGDTTSDILGLYGELGLKPYLIDIRGRLIPTSYEKLASSGSDEELVVIDFVLAARRPAGLVAGHYVATPAERGFERLLKLGGDLLEFVPERIRPRIRKRDRQPG